MKPSEFEFWWNGYPAFRYSTFLDEHPNGCALMSAYVSAWSGGIIILDNDKQHTIPRGATLAAKRKVVSKLYFGHLLKI